MRFAAYTRDPKVLAIKKHVVDEILKTQEEETIHALPGSDEPPTFFLRET